MKKRKLPGLRSVASPLLERASANLDDIDVAGPFLRFGGCTYPSNIQQTASETDDTLTEMGTYSLSVLVLTRHLKPSITCSNFEVVPILLQRDVARTSFSAWRFDISIPIHHVQQTMQYQIQWHPSQPRTLTQLPFKIHTFHVPGYHDSWHMAGFSCVGFHATNTLVDQGAGSSSLFANIYDIHTSHPFHLLLGGGDQIYNDDVFEAVDELKQFEAFPTHAQRYDMDCSPDLKQATLRFFLYNYIVHMSDEQLHPCLANIPWMTAPDDHDFMDGLGSYAPELELCAVWQGVKACGIQMFQLFQNHNAAMNPASPNGFCRLVRASPTLSILAIDSRTTRTRAHVLSDDTWTWLESLDKEVAEASHLIVLNPIPVIFGTLDSIQHVLERFSNANQKLGTSPLHMFWRKVLHFLSGGESQWRFGEPQLLDDCWDRWSAHIPERYRLLKLFWRWSYAGTRVTIMTGDVHAAAFGLFQFDDGEPVAGKRIRGFGKQQRDRETRTTIRELQKELHDPLAMFQIVTSAIGNEPPPNFVRWIGEMTDARIPPPNIPNINHVTGRFENDMPDYKEGLLTFGKLEQRERAIHTRQGLGLIHAREDHETNTASFDYHTDEPKVHPALYAIDRPAYQLIRILKRDTGRRIMRRRNWAELSEHVICGTCTFGTVDAPWIRVTIHAEELSSLSRMLKHKHEPSIAEAKPEVRKWELWVPALLKQRLPNLDVAIDSAKADPNTNDTH
jgi:hypothetical protein